MVPQRCHVLREGAPIEVEASRIVVGDIVRLRQGDKIPADLRVMCAANLKVDNSPLTVTYHFMHAA